MKALDIAIERAGGVGRLAVAIGVGQSVISNWRARGTKPDPVHCVAIERFTAVSRQDLRPDDWQQIWPELAAVPSEAPDPSAQPTTQEAPHG